MSGHGQTDQLEPYPDHSPDARTRLLSPISYTLRNFAALPIGYQRAVLLRRILRRENPTNGAPLERAVVFKNGFIH